MTPGEEALKEAMRLEQARIYGNLCPETRSNFLAAELPKPSDETVRVHDITAARLRRGVA
jgi:hypothetical protein